METENAEKEIIIMELISREDAISAIKALCMSDTPQMIWSSDAIDAIMKVEAMVSASTDANKLTVEFYVD